MVTRPLLPLAVALGTLAVIAVALALALPARARGRLPVARLHRLTALPAYARVRRRALLRGLALLLVAALTCGFALAGVSRPTERETISPKRHLRDVMLCLDTSGSMIGYDAEIIEAYARMVDSFDGERIGMTVFNSTAVTVFPLTDDYDMASEFLQDAYDGLTTFGTEGLDFLMATQPQNVPGSSLIGDGLASCVEAFDRRDEDRSRSIVLATDNELAGTPLFSLDEAAGIAEDAGVRVYALAPESWYFTTALDELEAAAERTGGALHSMSDGAAIDRIVASVQETEARLTDGRTVTLFHDRPLVPLFGAGLGTLILLVAAWRLKL
ncbi:vWA domain-containing protein [Brevibacterium album]|uniref:vWA domain-containing protein n=1 Tax=Brevibacterium album TaxID=417948 RepID=UPI00041A294E|nr:VWA domain-containing protein [Brevibacterium album]